MRPILPPSKRQALLFPGAVSGEDLEPATATPELIEALADLLLEAVGEERNERGGEREPEDHC
jgi:hypothetical protein